MDGILEVVKGDKETTMNRSIPHTQQTATMLKCISQRHMYFFNMHSILLYLFCMIVINKISNRVEIIMQ